jgi:hypothetical protein
MQIFRAYFYSPVSLQAFPADGSKLFVLTSDQTAFKLDVARSGAKTASN